MKDDIPDCILKPYALDGVVVAQRLSLVRAVKRPEGREAALLKEIMEAGEDREEGGEGIRLVRVCAWWAVVEERDAEIEVGEGQGREGLDEDVDDDVRVVKIWVELVAKRNLYLTQ